ncbi:MAG: hypothetical protein BWZ02_00867 [Lentisphaerae bacterium ADurb.BinA184]|nr:MAG: hypothetical protein BWZ02_00867 [Lentisphaerae bacterium ADurb.BinA184]
MKTLLPLVLACAAIAVRSRAADRTLTLSEQLGQEYGPELLVYGFSAPDRACAPDGVRLAGPDGPRPVQLTDVVYWSDKPEFVKTARLVFIADGLKPRATQVYTLTYGRKAVPRSESDLTVKTSGSAVEIITSRIGVRLPFGSGRLAQPAALGELPGPLAALRLRNGAWAGGSQLTGDGRADGWSSELLDAGPVVARVRTRYHLAGGATVSFTATLAAGDSAVHWEMEGSADHPGLGVTFRLPPVPGVKEAVLPHGYGQWARKDRTVTPSPGSEPFIHLVPDSSLPNCFPENACKIHLAAPDAAVSLQIRSHDPGRWVEPVAPFTYGGFQTWHADMIPASWENWRRLRMPVGYGGDGTVTLSASLAKGRRIWSVGAGDAVVGRRLDRIKEEVLDWPADPGRPHPRLFLSAEEVKAVWERAANDGELMKRLTAAEQRWAWNDVGAPAAIGLPQAPEALRTPQAKEKAVGLLREQVGLLGDFDVMRGANGVTGIYDALIDSGWLSVEDRALFRAQMAHLGYVLADPQCWSIERGYHSGNPNMSASYTLSLGLLACALADHPMAETWAQYAAGWMDKWLTDEVGPDGQWLPEGSHYTSIPIFHMTAFAAAARRAGFRDFTRDPRLHRLLLYYAKTQTPPDPRHGGFRATGAWGRGTSGDGMPAFAAAAWMLADSASELSRTLQWMWAEHGYPAAGADWMMGGYEPYVFDRNLPMAAPDWGTEVFSNMGVVCRSAFRTPHESYLIFLSHTDPLRNLDIWPPSVGSLPQWFGRGQPLSTCFNLDTGYAVRHELLQNGVRLARNWGAPEDSKAPFGHYVKTTPEAVSCQPNADYIRSSFVYTKVDDRDWFPNPPPPAYPRVAPAKEPKLEWTRQLLFVKDPDPAGPAYIVVRDTTRGGQPTAWQFWTLSEKIGAPAQTASLEAFLADQPGQKLAPARELPPGDRYTAIGQFGTDTDYFIVGPTETPRHTLRYGGTYGRVPEYQDLLHLQLPGDGTYFVVLFPRPRGEAAPTFTRLADGKGVRIEGPWGTDIVFLAPAPFEFAEGGTRFNGSVGLIQRRGQKVHFTLGAEGRVEDGGQSAERRGGRAQAPAPPGGTRAASAAVGSQAGKRQAKGV